MKIISEANETILKILKRFRKQASCNRLLHYCVEEPTEDGILLFNLLTRELVLLTEEEHQELLTNDYLRERWFVVPENTNEKELVGLVRWVISTQQEKKATGNITGYTIFPTTDCNARCFYCFELGRSRVPMSHETALKTVQYIKDHCGGEKVHLSWFGGEPLFNQDAIDTVCSGLREEGIAFRSTAVSNGYLFDADTVRKAAEHWNLKRVQITLDGTEKIYNKTKAFIYKEGNPYQTVLTNIGHLLDAEILVQIRLNMDLYNAENLLELVDELAARFGGRKGFHVYAHHIFDGDSPMAETHTTEEWEQRDEAMCRLEEKIRQHGLAARRGISKTLKRNFCMADSGSSVTILPDGSIGLCEHFSESEFIGHIDREGFDQAVVNSWKERIPEIPECGECVYYPTCLQLKKCASGSICFEQLRRDLRRKTGQEMLGEYHRWQTTAEPEEDEDGELC